jgi:hypothetical protein
VELGEGGMTTEEIRVLTYLQDAADRGAFALACDGSDRAPAHKLDRAGLAEWHGTNWGSSFWSITDAGRAALAQVGRNPEGGDACGSVEDEHAVDAEGSDAPYQHDQQPDSQRRE